MITCTFFTQNPYLELDYDLPERLFLVLDDIFQRNDDEFNYLFQVKIGIQGLAQCAIQLLQRGYSDKRIHTTYMNRENQKYIGSAHWSCAHSNILIAYCYEPMELFERKIWTYALRQKGLEIINLTSPKTQEALWTYFRTLSPQEQGMIEWSRRGLSQKAICEKYGIPNCKAFRAQHDWIVQKLRHATQHRGRRAHSLDCYGSPWAWWC